MKGIRTIFFVALLTAPVALARGATRPEPHQVRAQLPVTLRQLHPDDRGVLIADEYQAPVVEGVERPDSPAADAAQGNAEAQLPAVETAPSDSDVEQPPAENRPEVEQPPAQQ